MKLNPDCTRAFLLAVESICDSEHFFNFEEDKSLIIGDYTDEEVRYHARQCNLAGLLYKYSPNINGGFSVMDLSPNGHEFIANIREDTIWNNVKSTSAKVGSESLSALAQIAAGVVSQLIKNSLGLIP